uniref:Protein kinase domain-containing protein n=1 Tax=Periophthalmus magnuspinnatus TaxID=409849 RepID=A0A3B4AA28_9GOBI
GSSLSRDSQTSLQRNPKLQCLLGSGAYGDVSLCRNLSTNQTVALKVMKDPGAYYYLTFLSHSCFFLPNKKYFISGIQNCTVA